MVVQLDIDRLSLPIANITTAALAEFVEIPAAVAVELLPLLKDKLPGGVSKGVGPDTSTPENAAIVPILLLAHEPKVNV